MKNVKSILIDHLPEPYVAKVSVITDDGFKLFVDIPRDTIEHETKIRFHAKDVVWSLVWDPFAEMFDLDDANTESFVLESKKLSEISSELARFAIHGGPDWATWGK